MTTTPPCPDPTLYAFTVWKHDKRTKTGLRQKDCFTASFPSHEDAAAHAEFLTRTAFRDCTIQFRLYWVLRRSFMSGKNIWERWNTPDYCSVASETYWSS